jgi:predicted metal-dependent phosphoesterase TrpH
MAMAPALTSDPVFSGSEPADGGFDLHLHSRASDGVLAPVALAREAREAGLDGFSLTDHDTVGGLEEAARAAPLLDLRFLPGVELSAEHRDQEVHVLGYNIDSGDRTLRRRLRQVQRQRRARIARIVRRLRQLGFGITLDEVLAEAAGANLGRPHVAATLLRRGLLTNEDEVWRHYLGQEGAAFVPRRRPSVETAIGWIRDAGGVPVLAHPALGLSPALLPQLLDLGFAGLEVGHPEQDAPARRRLRSLARDRGLIPTSGSDSHGTPRAVVGAERSTHAVVEALDRAVR